MFPVDADLVRIRIDIAMIRFNQMIVDGNTAFFENLFDFLPGSVSRMGEKTIKTHARNLSRFSGG